MCNCGRGRLCGYHRRMREARRAAWHQLSEWLLSAVQKEDA